MRFRDYRKYRWFITSLGTLVIGGKNSKQNDFLLNKLKKKTFNFIILHTASPGSPFSAILKEKPSKNEIEESAIFTACFSQDWKRKKRKSEIHIFRLSQLEKEKNMKEGAWIIKGKIKKLKIPLKLVLTIQRKTLRAVPEKSAKNKILEILQGDESKEILAKKILEILGKNFKKEDILSALPSGGIKIKNV